MADHELDDLGLISPQHRPSLESISDIASTLRLPNHRRNDSDADTLTDRLLLSPESEHGRFNTRSSRHSPRVPQSPLSPNDLKQPQKRKTHIKLRHKLGWLAITLLIATPVVVLTLVEVLVFLWFSDSSNGNWHYLMVNQWATRAVSISAMIIRTIIDFLAGVGASMLAALALESHAVRLCDSAAVSVMRSGMASPWRLLLPMFFGSRKEGGITHYLFLPLIILLTTTTVLLQFSSTALLSDLKLGLLEGYSTNRTFFYDFEYNTATRVGDVQGWDLYNLTAAPLIHRGISWARNPPFYPTFGEYTEAVPKKKKVDDTGYTFRAFMPFTDAQSRQTVQKYTGSSFVVDSRVSCQQPDFETINVTIGVEKTMDQTGSLIWTISGSFTNSTDVPDLWTPPVPIPFECKYLVGVGSYSICQMQGPQYLIWSQDFEHESLLHDRLAAVPGETAGSLKSQLTNVTVEQMKPTPFDTLPSWGPTYLIFRSYDEQDLAAVKNIQDYSTDQQNNTRIHFEPSDTEWLNMTTRMSVADSAANNIVLFNQTISVSLCYTSWQTADLSTHMSSESSRQEPSSHKTSRSAYDFSDLRIQMGQHPNITSLEARNVLNLSETIWIPTNDDAAPIQQQPPVQAFADMSGYGLRNRERTELILAHTFTNETSNDTVLIYPNSIGFESSRLSGNWSALVFDLSIGLAFPPNITNCTLPDPALSSFFLEAMAQNGSVASTMSSLLTILSGMAYYDQFPAYTKQGNATFVFFSNVLYPQDTRGFTAVVILILLQTFIFTVIATLFVWKTRFSMLGNDWANVAQVLAPATEELVRGSSRAMDKEIKSELEIRGTRNMEVGVGLLGDGESFGITARKRWKG
ncbi:uncharacterized protein BDZ99DRAFT_553975 [Mytilinidion resinicola]|uniref:Uncharacterized protein n=1 Tax=Mytilinidion resinicola TaxID=574789 RepID=A0A6A6YYS7_9PEZI|nr:uncharacterized protein BDZ99DRAFT_553975 [Mytilinidion resinicola]KAF2813910.1 hypothetical protein BDZ99DRAFT_553975 [Mytilinidion resinicola]